MIRRLFTLTLFAAVVYVGYQYAAPQIRAWRFRDAMTQVTRMAGSIDDEDARRSLVESAARLRVPLSASRLRVRRSPGGALTVTARWIEIVDLRAGSVAEWVDTLRFSYEVRTPGGARR